MNAEIIHLNLKNPEKDYGELIDALHEGNSMAVFIVHKENGQLVVGSSAANVKDLVWTLHRINTFMGDIVSGNVELIFDGEDNDAPA